MVFRLLFLNTCLKASCARLSPLLVGTGEFVRKFVTNNELGSSWNRLLGVSVYVNTASCLWTSAACLCYSAPKGLRTPAAWIMTVPFYVVSQKYLILHLLTCFICKCSRSPGSHWQCWFHFTRTFCFWVWCCWLKCGARIAGDSRRMRYFGAKFDEVFFNFEIYVTSAFYYDDL